MRFLKSYIKLSALLILLFAPLLAAANASAQALSEGLLRGFRYRSIGPTRQSGRFVDKDKNLGP